MKPGDILHGFELQYSQPLPELKGTLHRFTYLKNGADAIWLERDDDNKSFAITFRTVPHDSTGVFHILEHSVLNGSEKYPLREPFVDLLKSSLATFLNAMTFPDKTSYPVSSRNDKDFLNLIDVYMDAVLHPLSLRDPHSFRQEGWHYELDGEEGELTVNGVVFNEMKGAYTSPDEVIRDQLNRLLFPDACYGCDSGGDPDHIPELTYENYLANHRRFYHPSNSYIFLDGRVDLDAVLEKLDGFLAPYGRIDPDSAIALQAPVAPGKKTVYYAIGPEEDEKNKAMLGRGWVYGAYDELEKNLAMSVLTEVLAGSNDSPLTKALLEAGMCEDVALERSSSCQQMDVKLILKNCDPANEEKIWALVDDTLRRQAEQGLDKKRLTSILSRIEFVNREKDFGGFPKGLVYGIECMNTWLYGGDPAQALCMEGLFKPLYGMIENGYFEKLLREVLLDGRHTASVLMLPSKTIAEEKRAAEQKRLAAVKAGWSQEQIRQVIADFRALRDRQSRPDTPEQQATLPRLSLQDIPARRTPVPNRVTEIDGTPLLHQDVDTAGISYLTLYFSLSDFDARDLSRASIVAPLLGSIATEHFDVTALRSETNEKLGRFSVYPQSHLGVRRSGAFVTVQIALLENSKQDAVALADEILNRSLFTDEAYILNLVRQRRIGMEQEIMMSGSSFAARHALSSLSPAYAMTEALQGLGMLRQLQKEEKEFGPDTLAWMAALAKRIFTRERVTLSVTGELDEKWVRQMRDVLCSGPMGAPKTLTPAGGDRDGFLIPSEIGFAARAALPAALENRGAAQVAAQFLTYDYLWNTIRVKGGAYGTGFRVTETGGLAVTSYRDPAPGASLQSFLGTADALRAFCRSGESLTQYIISTIGSIDPLRTPRSISGEAGWMYFSGATEEDLLREWDQVLHTTKEQLLSFADALEEACAASNICVVGGQTALDGCGDQISHVESVQ